MLALALWAAAITWVLALDDPRLRFPLFLAGAAPAMASWLWLVALARKGPWPAAVRGAVLAAALAARIAAIPAAPAFSEDVFRYVYEGRVALAHGPAFPFVHPPADAPRLGVRPELLDESWLRINHAHVPTLYPPLAQGVFIAAAALGEATGGGHLAWLKLLLVLADLGAWLLIALALKRLGRNVEESVVFGLCPLVIVEIAREAHADSLTVLGLALGVFGFTALRPAVGYGGWCLAALAKLNGLVLLPAALRTERRGAWLALLLLPLLALPALLGGGAALAGLGTYAGSWRAGDGAFSLLLGLSELLLGGDWRAIGDMVLTRHQLARGLTGLVFAGAATMILWRRGAPEDIPRRAGLLLFALLLLSPTLHPWYALWLLPFVPHAGRWRLPMLALLSLVWLGHHAGWLELVEGIWRESPWMRAAVHVPVWLAVGWVWRRRVAPVAARAVGQ